MGFCGFPWKLMKQNRRNTSIRTDMRSKYSTELNSYISACRKDSNLKTFDSSLHQRTNKVIKSLADQAETPSLSPNKLMEVYGFLFDLNQEAVKVIIGSKEDVKKNKHLMSLVEAYFKNTSKTLEFCNTVEKCVKKLETGQRIIQLAVKQFETESVVDSDNGENSKKTNKYAKTLEELNKFKAMGDPFDGEFETQYKSVYEEQVLLLEEFHKNKVKFYKKQRKAKTGRTVSNVLFATAFVTAFVLSVASGAMNAPPLMSEIAAGLTTPTEIGGKWFNTMWKDYEKAAKKQRGLTLKMEMRAHDNNRAMDDIRAEVNNLRNMISSFQETVEVALDREEEEVAIGFAMHKIKEEVDRFTEKIKEVGENAAMYSKLIFQGRDAVLDHP